MSPSTAREKVRVALALRDLPMITATYGQGRLSYSKVRALTRIATPQSDSDLADLAVAATGAQLDTIVRARKHALDADREASDALSGRKIRTRSIGQEMTDIILRVANDGADRALDAIDAEMSEHPAGAPETLTFTSRGRGLAPAVGQRLCCESTRVIGLSSGQTAPSQTQTQPLAQTDAPTKPPPQQRSPVPHH